MVADKDDLQSKAGELVKKILTVGVGAIFLTEESLRALVSEFKLPKEFLTGLLDSAGKTKNDFLQKLSADVMKNVTERVDLKELIQEALEKNEIDVQIKLNFRRRPEQEKK
jgi:hypothetical protein